MIIIAGAVIGAFWGVYLARKRNGNGLDMAQYAAASGIAFALVGLILTVILDRTLI